MGLDDDPDFWNMAIDGDEKEDLKPAVVKDLTRDRTLGTSRMSALSIVGSDNQKANNQIHRLRRLRIHHLRRCRTASISE